MELRASGILLASEFGNGLCEDHPRLSLPHHHPNASPPSTRHKTRARWGNGTGQKLYLASAQIEAVVQKDMAFLDDNLDWELPSGKLTAKADIPKGALRIMYRGRVLDRTPPSRCVIDWSGMCLDGITAVRQFGSPWLLKTNPDGNMQKEMVPIPRMFVQLDGDKDVVTSSILTAPAAVNFKEMTG